MVLPYFNFPWYNKKIIAFTLYMEHMFWSRYKNASGINVHMQKKKKPLINWPGKYSQVSWNLLLNFVKINFNCFALVIRKQM